MKDIYWGDNMKYLTFKVGPHFYALSTQTYFRIEPTQINKVTNNEIIYKGIKSRVIDLLQHIENQEMKIFDGLIFCMKEKTSVALKFEGLYKFRNNCKNCRFIDEDFLDFICKD